MVSTHSRWLSLITLAVLICAGNQLLGGDLYNKDTVKFEPAALPKPAEIQNFAATPSKIALKGMDDAQQIVITATLAEQRLQDLSGDVKYTVVDGKTERVSAIQLGGSTTKLRFGTAAAAHSGI